MSTYDDIGNGTALVLIHGFPFDRSQWMPQLEGMKDVARVIAPDLRGFGGAEEAPETMTMDGYATDVKDLLDRLGVDQAVICGLSMGGYVALALLAKHPHAVKGLILCNTRPGADSEQGREGRKASAKKIADEGMGPTAEMMVPKLLAEATRTSKPEVASMLKAMMERQRPGGAIAALRGMAARPDRTPMLPSIAVPTLVITGELDTLIPPMESEAMVAAIPGSELVVIPGVGHVSNLEDPQAFNGAVRKFLGRLA